MTTENEPIPDELRIEHYSEELEALGISDEQAHELLAALWKIMSTIVDIGWGVDTVQLLLPGLFEQEIQENKETQKEQDND